MYAKIGAEELKSSRRLRMASEATRKRFAEAFIATIQTEQVNKSRFRIECRQVGISPMLIILLLSIAWDVLWYWWTNRENQ
jgi:hypothetical protein